MEVRKDSTPLLYEMSSTTSATKRQRISRSGLENLPDDTLLNIATYLSHTTRALLSTALTAPSSSYDLGGHNENDKELMARDIEQIVRNHGWQPSGSESLNDILSSAIAAGQLTKINKTPQLRGGTLSKASKIVLMNPYYKESSFGFRYEEASDGSLLANGGKKVNCIRYRRPYEELWNELNFLDLDESLRMKLTDGDIAGVLTCLDAVNRLKTLRLSGCIKIRGDGLVPLCGSLVLNNVDLSIVPIEKGSTPMLSIDAVLPILESIVEMNQNSLHNVHIPKVWLDSYNEKLHNFYFEKQLLPNVHLGRGTELLSLDEKRRRYLLEYPNAGKSMYRKKMECCECLRRSNYTYGELNITCESDIPIEVCPGCGAKYCTAKPNTSSCSDCAEHEYSDCSEDEIKTCDICEKKRCPMCTVEIFRCNCCDKYICDGECGHKLECAGDCEESWEVSNCKDCAANDTNACTKQCRECNEAYCDLCEPEMTHLGDVVCQSCRG